MRALDVCLAACAAAACVGPQAIASAQACADTRTTTFVFANGMFTSHCRAVANADALAELVLEHAPLELETGEQWSFELAYNQDEATLEQLLEVAEQRIGADTALFWRLLSGLVPAPDWLRDALVDLSVSAELAPFEDDPDLAAHVARYRALVDSGSKVVVVAHSQGNLYANAGYEALAFGGSPLLTPALGVVGVATPADHVAGQSAAAAYTTLDADRIIDGVRLAFPATLPANVRAGAASIDALGHGFETAYLVVAAARSQIGDDVFRVEASLPQPQAQSNTTASSTHDDANCTDATPHEADASCQPDTWRGTCVDGFFGECWDPVGEPVTDAQLAGSTLTSEFRWPSGARVEVASSLLSPRGPTPVSVIGGSGQTCGTGQAFITDDPSCVGGAVYESSRGTLRYCVDAAGTLRGVCPDGSSFARAASGPCLYAAPSAGL